MTYPCPQVGSNSAVGERADRHARTRCDPENSRVEILTAKALVKWEEGKDGIGLGLGNDTWVKDIAETTRSLAKVANEANVN